MAMKSVLLVDDDNTVLLATGVRLKAMGYVVYTAKDAVSAISAVRKNEIVSRIWSDLRQHRSSSLPRVKTPRCVNVR